MNEYESLIQLSRQDPSYTDADRARLLSDYEALIEQLRQQNESQVINGDSLVVRQVTPETGTLLTKSWWRKARCNGPPGDGRPG